MGSHLFLSLRRGLSVVVIKGNENRNLTQGTYIYHGKTSENLFNKTGGGNKILVLVTQSKPHSLLWWADWLRVFISFPRTGGFCRNQRALLSVSGQVAIFSIL